MKKINLFILAVVVFLSMMQTLKAEDKSYFYVVHEPEDIYINNVEKSGPKNCSIYSKSEGNNLAYLLEYQMPLKLNESLLRNDEIIKEFDITETQWNKIKLYAFYGFRYKERTAIKWYCITQYLIEKSLSKNNTVILTDTQDELSTNIYNEDIEELETIVSQNILSPDFGETDMTFIVNKERILTDSNEVLDNFDIQYDKSRLNIEIEDNNLIIKALKDGPIIISFVHKDNFNDIPEAIYTGSERQTFLIMNGLHPSNFNLEIMAISENDELTVPDEKDSETKPDDIENGIGNTNEPTIDNISKEYPLPNTYTKPETNYLIPVTLIFSVISGCYIWRKVKK